MASTPIPCCTAAAGIRESSVYYTDPKRRRKVERDGRPLTCMKRLFKELQTISLPDHATQSIWIRYDEDTPQYCTAFMTGHVDTPYALGLFCFDIYIPNDYPTSPPKVKIVTGRGKARFGPNLYANGKVCLSILGTWPGPQWDPTSSNLYQVLISIQTYLLGAQQPWYLEPGFGGWEERIKTNDTGVTTRTVRRTGKTAQLQLPPKVVAYNNGLRCRTMLFAILDPLQHRGPYAATAVRELVDHHLDRNRVALRAQVDAWAKELEERPGKACRDEARFMQSVLVTILPVLRKALGDSPKAGSKDEEVQETANDNGECVAEADLVRDVDDDEVFKKDTVLLDDSTRTEPTIVESSSSSTDEAGRATPEQPVTQKAGLAKVFGSLPWRKRGETVKKGGTASTTSNTIYG